MGDLKGKAAAEAFVAQGGQVPSCYKTILEDVFDPIKKHYFLCKHQHTLPGPTWEVLGLPSNKSWLLAYFVERVLRHIVNKVLGWPAAQGSQPSAWDMLVSMLNSAKWGADKCWRPSPRGSAFNQSKCARPNTESSKSYMRLPTCRCPPKGHASGISSSLRAVYAHQVMCWVRHGPPPSKEESCVRHMCGHADCINPRCLRWGTPFGNVLDREEHKNLRKKRGVVRELEGVEGRKWDDS